ncbi:chromodomain protein, putative [Phytophthora infestans T30-4]|uniref:Chromodomain protein, putative n=1 Tax=Phytophthora infestans (strain T30-4) TaxID=403677 RepID=D0N2M4_PHYIT|nr:chromodomain protein, putative [Phytophthora infestans T30-4]EEY68553.1 chromodomain protein, putative [Phytophthora infestans T30-4]|eukprot:XP_002905712.1 chromodomain protein, putative [Phytophthora infestans T30-4]
MELADKLNYPSSGYKLKAITAFKIFVYHRDHALGDSDAVIPKIIRENKHVINFPKTNNKCVFRYIAWHTFQSPKKDPRRIQAQVKEVFKRYCSFKGVKYTLSLFRSFKPIDLLQLDEVEDCFQLGINVYSMDVASGNVECIRRSDKGYEAMDILSFENHALYIKNFDMLQAKYQCPKCAMVFVSAERVKNHKKNQCELVNIESFPAEPTIYKPAQNVIRSLLTKYLIKNTDQYIDHFIVYDFEAILKPTATQHGENTVFTNEHIPVSVSVADSLTEGVRCFVNDDPKMLLTEMFNYIGDVSAKIQQYNVNKYMSLLQKIINAHGLTGMEVPGANSDKKYKMSDVESWIEEGKYASFFDFHRSLGFGKQRSDYGKLKQQLDQVPVFGFNCGRYDIWIKKDLFAVIGTDNVKSVIKNPSYMCIATSDMKMLDITNYVPAGTSYDKYLTTYLGGCKCDDKIRCVCGLGKGLFPYEYITAFNVLKQTTIPPKSAFDSKLHLLIWYNNLDVVPFTKAIKAQRELFKRFDLDMFADGVSLPGLSEKVMYQTCFNNLQYPDKKPANAFRFPAKRMAGYKSQDAKAKRKFGMTLEHVNTLLQKQKYLCGLCYCQLTADTASADRINNNLGHTDGNILISCISCNTARKDMSLRGFRYKKLLDFNADRLRNETKIRGAKICKKIIGYDANALYLWALGNEMPCGRLTTVEAYDGIIDDIKADKVFGFLECDIRTPEYLKQYFGEMTPIFKNVLIDCTNESVIGKHMFEHNEARKQSRAKPARKLIGSYFGEKILIYAPLLKWYLSHGLEITETYSFIKASSHKDFAPFMEAVSNARREGDVDKSKAMIAEMMKLVGNSAFGRSGMDMSKHKEVKYESSDKAIKNKIEHFTFHGLEELNDACEITMKKRRLNNKNPVHLSIAIYQLAKLRMLQFYYDCINFYFDRSDFQYQEMDTDSAYIAFSCDNPFQDCIKPELRTHFKEHKYDWFPRDYNTEVAKFDRRTPGLFKDEWSGDAMVSLSSKNYICYLPDETYKVKVSAKGIQQGSGRNNGVLNPDGFETVVRDRITLQVLDDESKGPDIQRFQEQKKRFNGFKIASHNPNSWQIDLAFWKKRPILTAININSRLGDNGSEFMNLQAQELFKPKTIEHYNNEPGDHGTMGRIERFNRTLKQRLTKMSPKRITQKLITDVIENYNTTFHRSIGMTPNEAKGKVMNADLSHNQVEADRIEKEFDVGSSVLYRLKKQTFDKEAARWSKAAPNDLKMVNTETTDAVINRGDILEAEKILDHKTTRSGKYKYLIKWLGNEPDSWEPQDNLQLINKNRKSMLEKEYWAKKTHK